MAVLNLIPGVSCRVHLHGLRCDITCCAVNQVISEPKLQESWTMHRGNLVLETAEIYYVPDFKVLVTINSETFYSIFFMMSPPHSVVSPYMRHYYVIAAGVN